MLFEYFYLPKMINGLQFQIRYMIKNWFIFISLLTLPWKATAV